MHDLIIIGGGAAGMAAGVYGLGKRLDVVVISEEVGGKAGTQQQLRASSNPEYLAGAEAVRLFERQITAREGVVLRDRVVGFRRHEDCFAVDTQRHGLMTARAVVVATGAQPLLLDVPGAKALLNHGIGYSITTHAPLLTERPVAVVGTTERALQGVAELARHDARVALIAPEEEGLTSPFARALRGYENVTFFAGYQVREVTGSTSLEYLAIERDSEQAWLRVDAVFADLGLLPNSTMVRGVAPLDANGFIVVDSQNATEVPGLFAAGDVTTNRCENILLAIGEGARAAASAYSYLLARPLPVEVASAD